MPLPTLAHDKANHFIMGMLAYAVLLPWCPLAGLAAAVVAGAAKELYDWRSQTGTPEWMDFVATAAGGLFGFIITVVSANLY